MCLLDCLSGRGWCGSVVNCEQLGFSFDQVRLVNDSGCFSGPMLMFLMVFRWRKWFVSVLSLSLLPSINTSPTETQRDTNPTNKYNSMVWDYIWLDTHRKTFGWKHRAETSFSFKMSILCLASGILRVWRVFLIFKRNIVFFATELLTLAIERYSNTNNWYFVEIRLIRDNNTQQRMWMKNQYKKSLPLLSSWPIMCVCASGLFCCFGFQLKYFIF